MGAHSSEVVGQSEHRLAACAAHAVDAPAFEVVLHTGGGDEVALRDVDGECTLNFTNTDQTEHKLVTLNYDITHYIFGMPQMLFMVILIAVVSVAGVAVFIGLSRKPY